ncbi:VOC family protein [Chengkuizengella marina]|uniref:Glyoxalase/fosfomycin resistance/dioxygenase domain-containing protein n=1 Tax=Chengkuizengella marina TaxID=2507566 RepID=A0A6N9Q294_9BACL|nr:VOC family protein [Chengkuizengella marina]NBI28138.1 hypothetical protein [Chengkuizengella marina]
MSIKYAHTNIVAKDWRRLSDFYVKVFDCKPVYPERDLSGKWIDNVSIKGIHLTLPGYEPGPTLEIFQYIQESPKRHPSNINQQGFGHIAFLVDTLNKF